MSHSPWKTIVGMDLTDPHARSARAVDVALLDVATSHVTFSQLPWSGTRLVLPAAWQRENTLLVLDGPQAWALPPRGTRECERRLGTPAHTPHMPPPLGRPFAGYIRGSVSLFADLVADGWILPGMGPRPNLVEGYPGAAWPVLAGCRLPSKGSPAGLAARRSLLVMAGLAGMPMALSHDQLDAALLVLLGHMFALPDGRLGAAQLVGEPVARDWAGVLREGEIVMPRQAVADWSLPGGAGNTGSAALRATVARPVAAAARPGGARPSVVGQLGIDWVYFATTTGASRDETLRLVVENDILLRKAHNVAGSLIANVGKVSPGQRLLVAYGGEPLVLLEVAEPALPVTATAAISRLDEFSADIRAAGYDDAEFVDTTVGGFTGFLVTRVDVDLSQIPFARKVGNNALFRADAVTWGRRE